VEKLGLKLLPNDDLVKKLKILKSPVILLKNNNAGARATGRKFNLPLKIRKKPIIAMKEIITLLLLLGPNLLPNTK
jgi:hypothetical protein